MVLSMNTGFKKFALQLLVITIFITLAGFLLLKYAIPEFFFSGFLFMPLVLYLITLGVHRYLLVSSQEENHRFTYKFMGATGVKMFIYLVLIVIYLLTDREHAVPFLICFLILYVLYSVFEVLSVLKYLKNNR